MDIETYSRISTRVTAAGLEPNGWAEVLEEIETAFPSLKLHLFSQDVVNNYSNLGFTSGYAPEYLESYIEHYAPLNAWAPEFAKHGPGQTLSSFQMCSDDQLLKTEFYADWLRPQGDIIGGGGGVIGKTSTASALFGANIHKSEREVLEPLWMDFVGHILPTMTQAWNINRVLAVSEIERQLPEHARKSSAAVLLLRPNGYPTFINAAAQQLIEAGSGLQQDFMGRIWITGNAAANQFIRRRKWQRKDSSFEDRLIEGSRLWISELDPEAVSGTDLAFTFGMDTPGILVVLTKEHSRTDPKTKLQRRYRLTAAEAEVMLALGDGLSTKEIAEMRGVSSETVRHQIKHCATKCGVHRQTELAIIATRIKLDS